MKAKSVILLLFVAEFLTACYTAEFRPVPDYPVLREAKTESVEIVWSHPGQSAVILGSLIIRDFSGDLDDPAFLSYIKREARKRGASGAYISEKRMERVDSFLSDTTGRRQTGYKNPARSQDLILKTDIGIVTVLLFTKSRSGGN